MERKEEPTRSMTFVILKPLGTEEPMRSLILEKLKTAGEVVGSIKVSPTREQMYDLYKSDALDPDGTPKPYLNPMLDYFEGHEVEIVLLLGEGTRTEMINKVDALVGFWDPNHAHEGEIRHLLIEQGVEYVPNQNYDNLIHRPSSEANLKREISIFIDGADKWI